MISNLAREIRKLSLEMVAISKASHIGSALSIADILATLYEKILNYNIKKPSWENRDRFILSKGHACVALYATLACKKFILKRELKTYGKNYSRLMSHISHHVPGVEFSTGSLGHGLPFGVGKALISKKKNKKWKTYVLMSDGELGEGSNWEALLFASHHKLDNLSAIVDYNKLQSFGSIEDTLSLEPLEMKFRSFGWEVRIIDGHNFDELYESLSSIPWVKNKPSMIIAKTIKGKGVSFMENSVDWHYRSPTNEQLKKALIEISKQ